jgi:glucosyl-3-phosphoglycerate synthase
LDVIDRAIGLKADTTVSICIPCHNESRTIGDLVERMFGDPRLSSLIDDLLVIDDHSTDATAAVARSCGARVVSVADQLNTSGPGKGGAIFTSILASTTDVLVWLDADIQATDLDWVAKLSLPLLADPELMLVKGDYGRPPGEGGGRNTELVARPLISLFFPELGFVRQPLAGEMAVRRRGLLDLRIPSGWGIEMAMLLDLSQQYGAASITQVDLGEKVHRHRPLADLSLQAAEIMCTVFDRVDDERLERLRDAMPRFLITPQGSKMLKSASYPTAREFEVQAHGTQAG